MNRNLIIIIVLLCLIFVNADIKEECPNKCSCQRNTQQIGQRFIKLKCGIDEKINTIEEIELLNIANDIISWNLSGNYLTTFSPKIQMVSLQKLYLNKNRLTELKNYQFIELPNLKRLDLSDNQIKLIELFAFQKLENLERLKLNGNQITSLGIGILDPLLNLRQLDISNNRLSCDCGLLWLLDWCDKTFLKLTSNPKCTTPTTFKGLPLRKLKIGDNINCKSPVGKAGIAIIQMKPHLNQVVFEGDDLELHCKAPGISDTFDSKSKIEWTWLDSDPRLNFNNIEITNNFLEGVGLLDSTLKITKLTRNHTGIWNCILISQQGNHSKGITVIVITNETKYCPITVTTNNKGTYVWPRTIIKYRTTLPCQSINSNYDTAKQKATYYCDQNGKWIDLNTTTCQFVSETTKIFEQFTKVNANLLESAKHFRNFTTNLKHFNDNVDIVFTIKTIENYLKQLTLNQIGGILIDIINNILQLPQDYLKNADFLYKKTCAKIVNITEKLAGINSSLLHKTNLATEIFKIKPGFGNLKCDWYTDRLFNCFVNNELISDFSGKNIEASITIPEDLFDLSQINETDYYYDYLNILVTMFANNKLFPIQQHDNYEIKSSVVGAKLLNQSSVVIRLKNPIVVILKIPQFYDHTPIPVRWDWSLNNNTGGWINTDCHINVKYHNYIEFFCYNFGYYSLLSNKSDLLMEIPKFFHPINYIGNFIIFTSFMIVIVTYLINYNEIQMAKKTKHSLINTWLSISGLCFVYVCGIHQTQTKQICQIIGMLLHYFTLSSLLWMCVSVNCMYNRLKKHDLIELQDDELMNNDQQPLRKPIIGLYFVGCGIALIICGISAAINIKEYASNHYCFLRTGPPLSALYIPVVLIFAFILIFFLLIKCTIYNLDSYLSEGTQATENVDLDLIEPNFINQNYHRNNIPPSVSSKTSEMQDPEHGPTTQLKSYLIFLILYTCTWLSCALSTVELKFFIFAEEFFSVMFVFFATILSAFTMFFYCISRSDVRGKWVDLCLYLKKKLCLRSRTISDTNPQIHQIQPPPLSPIRNSLIIQSRSSSRSSNSKSNKSMSVVCRDATNLNKIIDNDVATKMNNINLIILHNNKQQQHQQQQYWSNVMPNIVENPTNTTEIFYNAQQSIVAKKFFKRQRRHMMKKMQLPIDNNHLEKPSTSYDYHRNRKIQKPTILDDDSSDLTTWKHRRHKPKTTTNQLIVECTDENNQPVMKIQLSPIHHRNDDQNSIRDDGDKAMIYVNFQQTNTKPTTRSSISDFDNLERNLTVPKKMKNPKLSSLSDSNINSNECSSNTFTSSDNIETTV